MRDVDFKDTKVRVISGLMLMAGFFTLAVGAGMYFFGTSGSDDVRVISASSYNNVDTSRGKVAGESVSALVNINSASAQELEKLPGIGPVTAGKIIAGRPYTSIDELLVKKVVGRSTYEKISPLVTVGE